LDLARSAGTLVRAYFVCRKLECQPYASCPPADLPSERVSEDLPFSHTGLDFAGPLYINSNAQPEKVYICLYTCAAIHDVHLELVRDLGIESFLLSFRRFVGRRGLPATLISDNAKTLRSSSKDRVARSSEVLRYLTNNHTS